MVSFIYGRSGSGKSELLFDIAENRRKAAGMPIFSCRTERLSMPSAPRQSEISAQISISSPSLGSAILFSADTAESAKHT